MIIDKKDWELILKNNQEQKDQILKNVEMAIPQLDLIIELAKKKISEFPDEKDEIPETIKEIAKELKNA